MRSLRISRRTLLKAGAVAIRTYAWYWVNAGGKYDCADIDDTTASQVYKDARVADKVKAESKNTAVLVDRPVADLTAITGRLAETIRAARR